MDFVSSRSLYGHPLMRVRQAIDDATNAPDGIQFIVGLLNERNEVHRDRSADHVNRIRGYALATFVRTGLPSEAVIHVLSELQNGHHGYTVAAAARAIRGSEPNALYTPYLLAAAKRFTHADEQYDLARIDAHWPLIEHTTVLAEIFTTIEWMGASAWDSLSVIESLLSSEGDRMREPLRHQLREIVQRLTVDVQSEPIPREDCCGVMVNDDGALNTLDDIRLQDQDGGWTPFNEYVTEYPSLIVFFYTRCDNPNKCSLTVTRLAQIQRRLIEEGLASRCNLAAITYDPSYDLPHRLKSYGTNRGIDFSSNARFFRTDSSGLQSLYRELELGVSYSGSAVMSHRIEAFVLDDRGSVKASFNRLQLDVEEVVSVLRSQIVERDHLPATRSGRAARTGVVMAGIGLALFPKCPFCFAAYLSAFGLIGASSIKPTGLFVPVLVGFMGLNLMLIWRSARRRNYPTPFYVGVAGTICLTLSLMFNETLLRLPAVSLLLCASAMQVVPSNLLSILRSRTRRLVRKIPILWTELRARSDGSMRSASPRGSRLGAP